jgi:hypothetical protein
LPVARQAPVNYVVVVGMIVALVTLDDSGSAAFLLTAIGLGPHDRGSAPRIEPAR